MDFRITLVGLNHRTADVDVRERFSLADFANPESWPVPCNDPVREALILSTCNRVEILAVSQAEAEQHLLERWAAACHADCDEISRYAYKLHDGEAIQHIFNVAASLDSMVLGEPQILGQLKSAYRTAVESGHAGAILNRLMHSAFHAAKRVRNETAIAANAVSVSYAAVELAKRIFDSFPGRRAMLIGAGEMAELAALHLLQAGIDEIIIANRTWERGKELADRFRGQPIQIEAVPERLADVDIIIASTGSREPLLNAAIVKKALKARRNRPMFFIDIAVPRDIDPDVNELDNVYLYDIDDLKDVVEENLAGRKEEALQAQFIINEEVAEFQNWLENLQVKPVILKLIERGEEACQAELARTLKHLGDVPPETLAAMRALAKGIAKRLNHDPIMYLKEKGADQPGRVAAVTHIFGLDRKKN